MDVGVPEILEGSALAGGIGYAIKKYIYPMIKSHQKAKTEERKLSIKLSNSNSDVVVTMLKEQIEKLEKELTVSRETIIEKEIKVSELKTRLQMYAKDGNVLHSRGGKKEPKKK